MEQQDSTLSWKKAKEDDIIGGGKKKKSTKKDGKKNGKKSGKKRRTTSTSSEEEDRIVHKVNRNDGEMPEGAKSTDDEDEKVRKIEDFQRNLEKICPKKGNFFLGNWAIFGIFTKKSKTCRILPKKMSSFCRKMFT